MISVELLRSEKNCLETGNWATTFEPLVINRTVLSCNTLRQVIDRSPHVDLWLSLAETSAPKSLSGSTSYFTERQAIYSPIDTLFRKASLSIVHYHITRGVVEIFPSNNKTLPLYNVQAYL